MRDSPGIVLSAWAHPTRVLGERLGADAIPHLLAVMVHPPEAPESADVTPYRWLLRVQQAAALTLAQAEGGWAGTRRRAALHSLLHGPADWTVQAAAVALAHVAPQSPEIEAEALAWFEALLQRVPRPGHVCWHHAVLAAVLRLPSLPAEARARWTAELKTVADL